MESTSKSGAVVITSGSEIIKNLSNNKVSLSEIDGFVELTKKQQKYISTFVDLAMQETLARVTCNVTRKEYNEWLKDETFVGVLQDLQNIFTEGLVALDYTEALTDSKVRGRVLESRNAKGYGKSSGNKTINVLSTTPDSLPNVLKGI